jgi:hypothetical protein
VLDPSAVTVPLSADTPAVAAAATTSTASEASAITFFIVLPELLATSPRVSKEPHAAWAESG